MENILVLDSGIGGIYTAKILKEKYPNFNYIYFKDSFNCPYGNKNKEELLNLAQNNINFVLKSYKISAIVLACNTLSTNCKNELKQVYNLPIFSVEPPLDKITKTCLILCTKTCYNALKKNLIGSEEEYGEITLFKTQINNNFTIICAMHNLAFIIEKNINNKLLVQNYLSNSLTPIKNEKFSEIVLGCTHYNFVKNEIASLFNNCEILEGSQQVNLNNLKY